MRSSTSIRILAIYTIFHVLNLTPANCQWERLPGPFGGSVHQFEPYNNQLFAYTSGGIFKSNTDDINWSLLEGTDVHCSYKPQEPWFFKYLQVEGDTIWLLKPEEGLLCSKNGGISWSVMFKAQLTNEVLQSCFATGDTVFVSSNRVLYRSVDCGNSWSAVPDPNYYGPVHVQAKIKNTFVGRREFSIQVSHDGGLQWANVFSTVPVLAAVATVDTTVFGMYSTYARLIRSEDFGKTWEKFDTDSIHFEIYDTGAPGWLAGTGDDLFFATEDGCHHAPPRVFHSSNRGESWRKTQQQNLIEQQLGDVYFAPEGLFLAALDGVYRSADKGATFQATSTGMNAARINEVFHTPDNHLWAVARQGVFRSPDEGLSWEEVLPSHYPHDCGDMLRILRTQKRMISPGLYDRNLMYSEDNGTTWAPAPVAPNFYFSEIATTANAVWFRTYGDQLYIWRDNDPEPVVYTAMPFPDNIYDLQASNGTLLVVGLKSMFISKDQGEQWQELSDFHHFGSTPATGWHMAMDQYSIFRWKTGQKDTLFKLDYAENIWRPYFPVDAVSGDTFDRYEISLLQLTENVRWMGVRNRGLFFSSLENPDIWHPFEPQLPGITPKSVLVLDENLLVGTEEAGIYKTSFTLHSPESPQPHFTVYPNPGTGSPLNIGSNQFFPEGLLLRVFDMAGRMELEQKLNPGQHWAQNLSSLSGGMHILQFTTERHQITAKWIKH